MRKNNIIKFITAFFLISNTAFAATVMSSGGDQNFYQNYPSTQLFDIRITEDASTASVKAGTMKLTIPGTIDAIFDSKRSTDEVLLYGTAVNNGRIDQKPQITFEDDDRTIVFPVKQDFGLSEYVVITRLFAEGFQNQPADSVRLKLTTQDGSQITDLYSKYIQTSSTQDTTAPDMPTAITVADAAGGGVMLQWKDPTDLDLKVIQIFKGKNGELIAGPIAEVAKGIQKYNDKNLVVGDTVKYRLKAFDGLNYSDLTAEVTYVVGSSSAVLTQQTTQQTQQATQQITQQATQQTQQVDTVCKKYFSDVNVTDENCPAIQYLKENKIIDGYADGTFKPDQEINRVEFLKMVLLMFKKALILGTDLNFNDLEKDAWYATYIATAKQLGAINGYPDGTFKPGQTINKVETMKIIMEISGKDFTKVILVAPFADTPLNSWYLPYVQYFKDKSLDLGNPDGTLTPDKKMTRGEIAKLLYGFSKL